MVDIEERVGSCNTGRVPPQVEDPVLHFYQTVVVFLV